MATGFIDGIIPISDEVEVKSVNKVLECKLKSVQEHLSKADHLLADRESLIMRIQFKESIRAVEAICVDITGITGKEATLGNLIKN